MDMSQYSFRRFTIKKTYLHLLVIGAAGLLIYSNTFSVPFIFDDERNIVNNQTIRSLDNFISSTEGYEQNPRRFIGYLTFALNYHFGRLNVFGYHLVNLAIHLINAFLVYFLVMFTFRTPFFVSKGDRHTIHDSQSLIALFSALLFVAHPIQTQAVTYIVQRFSSLATMFYLFSIVLYIKGRLITQQSAITGQQSAENSRFTIHVSRFTIFWYLLSLLSAVLAMKTKEISFTLPLVILLYEFIFFKGELKKRFLPLLPVILIALTLIPLSLMSKDQTIGELLSDLSEKTRVQSGIPRVDYLMTEMRVIVTYIRLIVLPINQSLDYDYPIYHSLFTLPVLASFLFLLSLVGIAVYLLYRSRQGARGSGQGDIKPSAIHYSLFTIHCFRLIAFGILWFFITLSVESSIIPITDVIFEHRVYLPSVGFFFALSTLIVRAGEKLTAAAPSAARTMMPLISLLIFLLSIMTYSRNVVWQDAVTLWEKTVRNQPASFRAHYNLGTLYEKNGRLEEAMRELQSAIILNTDSAEAHVNLGMVYSKQGRLEKAIGELKSAISLKPNSVEAHQNLQIVYVDLGRLKDAESELRYVYAINHYEQSVVYNQQGRLEEALRELTAAVAVKPDYAEAYNGLGIVYDRQGRLEEAVRELQTAVSIKPDYPEAHNNLGILYAKQGNLREAERHLQAAVAIRPDYREAKKNLERVLTLKGNRGVDRSANQP